MEEALECCGSGGGYSCTVTEKALFDGSVTTADHGGMNTANFTPTSAISGDTITVTLNGTEYELPYVSTPYGDMWGKDDGSGIPVFDNYPCAIMYQPQYGGTIATEAEGTYTLKIVGANKEITISDCFKDAVRKAMSVTVTFTSGNISYPTTTEKHIIGTQITLPSGAVTTWLAGEQSYQPGDTYIVTQDVTFSAFRYT